MKTVIIIACILIAGEILAGMCAIRAGNRSKETDRLARLARLLQGKKKT